MAAILGLAVGGTKHTYNHWWVKCKHY